MEKVSQWTWSANPKQLIRVEMASKIAPFNEGGRKGRNLAFFGWKYFIAIIIIISSSAAVEAARRCVSGQLSVGRIVRCGSGRVG